MKIRCPKCKRVAPPDQVNMAMDLAFCTQCNDSFKISETVDQHIVNADILREAPMGAWFKKEMGEIVVGASTRSPMAFFLVPFMFFWTGSALGGIYASQITEGQFELGISLFSIPFIFGSIVLCTGTLMTIFGKVEVSIGKDSSVFTGIGSVGWTRHFDWSAVQTIRETGAHVGYPGSHDGAIALDGITRLKFGTGLNEQRRYFVLNVLKHLKAERR